MKIHIRSLRKISPLLATFAILGGAPASEAADATGRPVRVMPVGDSITEGQGSRNYRNPLLNLAVADGKTIDFVGHNPRNPPVDGESSGEGGWRADQMSGVAPPPTFESPNIGDVRSWIPDHDPDIILIMAGKNDILQGRGTSGTTTNVETLIDRCFAANPNVRIIVGNITPQRSDAAYTTTHISVNNNIASYVSTLQGQGKKIELVDHYSLFFPLDSSDFSDSVHPSQSGYDMMADAWYAALAPYLNNESYVPLTGTVIGSGKTGSGGFANAFDGDNSTGVKLLLGGWVGLDLGSAKQIGNIRVFHNTSGNNVDRNLRLEASNSSDFSNAVKISNGKDRFEDAIVEERTVTNTTAYRYVRARSVNNSASGDTQVRELTFFTLPGGSSGGGGSLNVSVGGSNQSLASSSFSSYASGQDLSGGFTIEDGGATIRLTGNSWKKAPLNYTITANTVLKFDFRSTDEGEIHAIALDDNNDFQDVKKAFQVHGSQTWSGGAFTDFNNYSGSSFTSYTIPVGTYYTGAVNNIAFINDGDSNTGIGFFRNIEIFESGGGGGTILAEDFNGTSTGSIPSGWTRDTGAGSVGVVDFPSSSDRSLRIADTKNFDASSASADFAATSGVVTVSFRWRQSDQDNWTRMQVRSGSTVVADLRTRSGNIAIEGSSSSTNLLNYASNTWYDIEIELDTGSDTFDVRINGALEASNQPFKNAASSVSRFRVNTGNGAVTNVWIDDLLVSD